MSAEETPVHTLSLSEFAAEIGVQPSYVTKLKQAGRLIFAGDGRVDVAASKARIKETEGRHGSAVREHWQEHRAKRSESGDTHEQPLDVPDSARDDEEDDDKRSRAYWDRREAAAKAQIRERELAVLDAKLVEASVVQAAGSEFGAALRSMLEALPDQLAPSLVGISDEGRIHAMLLEHIESLLTELSRNLETMCQFKRDERADT